MVLLRALLTKLEDDEYAILGSIDVEVGQPGSLTGAAAGGFAFCRSGEETGRSAVLATPATVVVVPLDADQSWARDDQTLVRSPAPRRTFLKMLQLVLVPKPSVPGVHETAVVDETAEIHPTATIGALCTIGANTRIGPRVVLHSNVVIGAGTTIGADCTVFAGTVIGSDGFGYERDGDREILKFPHLGGVRIGERVEIGANCCIDRGSLNDTVIEDDVKISNLVHVAHNVRIESRAFVTALSMLAGSVHIGSDAWIAPGSVILNGLSVGAHSLVGMGAVVIRPVPPYSRVAGNPARQLGEP